MGLDLLLVVRLCADRRDLLFTIRIETLLTSQHLRVEEFAHESLDEPFIFVVGDSAALVDLGSQDFEHFLLNRV